MVTKSNFTKEEWQKIKDGPEWVFAALSAADGNVAITTKAKESKAFKDVINNFTTTSPIIKEILEDESKTSREVKGATLSDAEKVLQEINKLIEKKLSLSEANQYREFLVSVAESVAEAAGEGAFGLGKKISKKEEKALNNIKVILKPAKAAKVEAKPVPKPSQKPVSESSPKPAPKPVSAAETKPERKPIAHTASQKPRQTPRPVPGPVAPKIPPQETIKKEEIITEHTVTAGETLSHISLKYYNSAVKDKWMVIYEANKEIIGENPNLIKQGMVLKIPKLDN